VETGLNSGDIAHRELALNSELVKLSIQAATDCKDDTECINYPIDLCREINSLLAVPLSSSVSQDDDFVSISTSNNYYLLYSYEVTCMWTESSSL